MNEIIVFDSWTTGLQGLGIQISFAIGLLFLARASRKFALVIGGAFFALNLAILPLSLSEYLGSGEQSVHAVWAHLNATRASPSLAQRAFYAQLFNTFCMTFSPSIIFGLTTLRIYRLKNNTILTETVG